MVQEWTPAGTMKSSSRVLAAGPADEKFERAPANAAGGPVPRVPDGAGGLPMLSQRNEVVAETNPRLASHSGADVSRSERSVASLGPASTPIEKDRSEAAISRPAVRAAAGEDSWLAFRSLRLHEVERAVKQPVVVFEPSHSSGGRSEDAATTRGSARVAH